MQGLNDAGALWLATGKIHHGKLLIGLELHEVGTEANPTLLALVVIDLDGVVVVALEGDKASLISPNAILEANELLDLRVKGHGPELFVSQQHVGLPADGADGTITVVSHVDALVGIQWDSCSLLQKYDLHRWSVPARPLDHPPVDSVPDRAIGLSVSLLGAE